MDFKLEDLSYDEINQVINLLKWLVLVMYIIFFPLIVKKRLSYGSAMIFPVFLFSMSETREGTISAVLSLPLNVVLYSIFTNWKVLESIIQLVFPTLVSIIIVYAFSSYF